MLILGFILYLLIGAFGFLFWWTKDYDFTIGEIPLLVPASLLGPISWIFGYIVHANHNINPIILVRKRK